VPQLAQNDAFTGVSLREAQPSSSAADIMPTSFTGHHAVCLRLPAPAGDCKSITRHERPLAQFRPGARLPEPIRNDNFSGGGGSDILVGGAGTDKGVGGVGFDRCGLDVEVRTECEATF
jgi:hypothetical protein